MLGPSRRAAPSSWMIEQSHPFQVSHAVHAIIHAAVDQLHAVRCIVQGDPSHENPQGKPGSIHVYAEHTLIRSAIESVCTGLWLLSPATRSERLERVFRLTLQEVHDMEKLARSGQADMSQTLESG